MNEDALADARDMQADLRAADERYTEGDTMTEDVGVAAGNHNPSPASPGDAPGQATPTVVDALEHLARCYRRMVGRVVERRYQPVSFQEWLAPRITEAFQQCGFLDEFVEHLISNTKEGD